MSGSELQERYAENIEALVRLNNLAGKLYRSNPLNKKKVFMDISSDDVLNLLKSLNKYGVKYLLVGGMAGVVHGHIRTTQDMDLWIKKDPDNAIAFVRALNENDVPGADLLRDMPLIFGWTSVRFGLSGFELDLGHSLKAFQESDFDSCYERALIADFEGVSFSVIHLRDLIIEKKATARAKDLADVEELQSIWESQQSH
ncbi:DUF6036 family nucleotidyltransferase [Dyadobacter sp. CY323]|uniref:DUF6036 family nucleotidyltransferase n=1 Tax=Dyadobacter sp. CY323 TaxID=2907302 RepID=UPI001F3C9397|nr:DUF6036 family nucleotidyltransferase [Dyadobacter sp. CY323]MCE6989045.1 hypothetical protein [Dyadobacter sp. CY323]